MRTVVTAARKNCQIMDKNSSEPAQESSSVSAVAVMTLEEKYREVKKATDTMWICAGVNHKEFTYYKIADS